MPPTVIKKVSPTDAFKSDIAKDKWPAGPTKTVGTDPDPMFSSMKSGYGILKGTITKCKQQVYKSRNSMSNLNSLDEKLKNYLEGILELRHQMSKMDQLPAADKDKIHDDYHHYERIVRDARHDIQKHLNVLRQKEADHTGGARAKVPTSESDPKREEHPRRKDHDRYFSDDLSKKDGKVD